MEKSPCYIWKPTINHPFSAMWVHQRVTHVFFVTMTWKMVIFPYETMMFLWKNGDFFPENGGLFQPAAAPSCRLVDSVAARRTGPTWWSVRYWGDGKCAPGHGLRGVTWSHLGVELKDSWLVIEPYPSEKWWTESQLGWWHSQLKIGVSLDLTKLCEIMWCSMSFQSVSWTCSRF